MLNYVKLTLAALLVFAWSPVLGQGLNPSIPEDPNIRVRREHAGSIPQRTVLEPESFALPLFTDGLCTRYSPNVCPEASLTVAENVVLDEDVNGVVVRRKGFVACNTTAVADSGSTARTFRGLWNLEATDGTRYQVGVTSETFYEHSGDCVWTAISPRLTGFAEGNDWDCVPTLGRLWCLNGATVISWEPVAAATATISGAPNGTLIAAFRNRLMIANISGSQSRIRLSGQLDGTDWTIPTVAVDTHPANIDIGGINNGNNVSCLMGVYDDKFLVGLEDSLFALYGFSRADFVLREISREVGCLEDKSVQEKNNAVYWISKRGLEKLYGPSITRVSDPVRDLLDTIIATAGNARSAIDSTQGNFESGNLTASGGGAPISATISPGNIVVTSHALNGVGLDVGWKMADIDTTTFVTTFIDNFDDGNFTGDIAWTDRCGGNWAVVSASSEAFAERIATTCSGSVSYQLDTETAFSTGAWSFIFTSTRTDTSFEFYFVADSTNLVTSPHDSYRVSIQDNGFGDLIRVRIIRRRASSNCLEGEVADDLSDGNAHTVVVTRASNGRMGVTVDGEFLGTCQDTTSITANFTALAGIVADLNDSSRTQWDAITFPPFYEQQVSTIYDTGLSTPIYSDYSFTGSSLTTSSVTFHVQTSTANDGGAFTAFETVTLGTRLANQDANQYFRHRIIPSPPETTTVSTVTASDLVSRTTAYFIAQGFATTDVSEYGLISCSVVDNDGSLTIYITTATTQALSILPGAEWTEHTNNTNITVGLGAFTNYRLLFTVDSGSQNPTAQDCTIAWQEGATRPPVASVVFRDRYHLAFTSSTAAGAFNDHQLVLDRNDKFTLFSGINCYSMNVYSRDLYCGSSENDGFVYQQDVGTNDNGSDYASVIRTKAFNMGMPAYRKAFDDLYLDLSPEANASDSIILTAGYRVDLATYTTTMGTVDLGEDPARILTPKFPFPLDDPEGVRGRYLSIELRADGQNQDFRLFGGRVYYKKLSRE